MSLSALADRALVEDLEAATARVRDDLLQQITGLQVVTGVLRKGSLAECCGIAVIIDNHIGKIVAIAEELEEAHGEAREMLARMADGRKKVNRKEVGGGEIRAAA